MRNFYKKFEIIPKNKKLFPKIIFGGKGNKVELFYERFGIFLSPKLQVILLLIFSYLSSIFLD
tara:strand:- start:211 stop:399 length:189 start_codon:yes stop_codon:yes gene_type:complete